jgi:hypothetical protein
LSTALCRPDVLADRQHGPLGVEQARRVESARSVEHTLRLAEPVGHRNQHVGGNREPGGHYLAPHGDVVERGLSADAARRRRVEVPGQPLGVERPRQRDRDDVVPLLLVVEVIAIRDPPDVVGRHQSFGEQEPGSELEVAARRPHRHRDPLGLLSRTLGPDLERLLGREGVRTLGASVAVDGDHPDGRDVAADLLGRGHAPSMASGEL